MNPPTLLLLALSLFASTDRAADSRPPNVVIVFTDDKCDPVAG